MARRPALVLSVHLATGGKRGESVVTAFRPPRGSLILPLTTRRPHTLAMAVAGVAADDAVILLDAGWGERQRYDPAPLARELRSILPEAEILLYDADAVLRFLWHYRDRHDPLALGHARERDLFADGIVTSAIPRHRGSGRRTERRRAVEEIRALLVTMGTALGIRAPLPPLLPAPSGWGAKRLARALDAVAGLYAGMLHRFQAPIATRRETESGPALVLADRG